MTCSKCPSEARRGQSYCLSCHAAYMRENRPVYSELTPEQRQKQQCRAYTRELTRRGRIQRQGCRVCGDPAQRHHPDYSDPYRVEWLCTKHHREHHQNLALA